MSSLTMPNHDSIDQQLITTPASDPCSDQTSRRVNQAALLAITQSSEDHATQANATWSCHTCCNNLPTCLAGGVLMLFFVGLFGYMTSGGKWW